MGKAENSYPIIREAKEDARAWVLKSWYARVRRIYGLSFPPAAFDRVYDASDVHVVCDSSEPDVFISAAVTQKGGEVLHFLHTKGAFRSRRYEEVLLDVVSPNTKVYTTFYDRLLLSRPNAMHIPFWVAGGDDEGA